ncbi:MAG: hypothetical protein QNK37_38765 [Acidobacteriota bacterium]|nr:hypothetical protein [Acidobacteriota bacterium]
MKNGGLVAKKPCRICRKFFRPNPRVGDRQKVCNEVCRKEWRKRQNQLAYRKSKDYHRGRALRKKLASEETESEKEKPVTACSLQLPREDIQAVMGAQAVVVLEYLLTMLFRLSREGPW